MPLTDNQFDKALEYIKFKMEGQGLDKANIRVLLRWVLDKIADNDLSDLRTMAIINAYLLARRQAFLQATKTQLEAEISAIDDELNG